MLSLSPDVRVHLALGATDMRKSFDTLAALVQEVIGQDPLSGHVFAFCNRRRNRLKILRWDQTGYYLLAKRLEQGQFDWPKAASDARAIEMTQQELKELLGGASASLRKQRGWYDWHAPRASTNNHGPQVNA